MKSLIHYWAKNPVAANFLMIAILVMGIFTWFKLRKEIFPEISVDIISITVPYPNASPDEVETGVSIPIEEAIQDLPGIKKLTSTSAENAGTVLVEVNVGEDTRKLLNDIKSRVDAIQNFSENVEKPIISEVLLKTEVLTIAVMADTDEATLRSIAEKVRDDLMVYEGKPPANSWEKLSRGFRDTLLGKTRISQVELAGVRDHEISIEISEQTLREYGLTFDQVAHAVRASSLDLPGGSIRTDAGEILIRAQSKRYTAPEFEKITVFTRPDGSEIKLHQIAKVIDAFQEDDLITTFDGHPAILVKVRRTGDEDTIQVARLAREYVTESSKILPAGVSLSLWNDQAVHLEERINLLLEDGFQGFVLVFIALSLFLRPGLAIWVAAGIPIAFAGALVFLPIFGITLNMVSLFAFIVVLGIVTDDAIVVGERINERLERGEPAHVAAPRGTWEVMSIAAFGVFTVIIAFMPMLGVQGPGGKIWSNIPLVVIPVMIVSLIETNFILPSHLTHLKRPKALHEMSPWIRWIFKVQRAVAGALGWFVNSAYRPAIKWIVDFRYATVAMFISVFLLAISLIGAGIIKFEFFPRVEAEILSAKITMPNGVAFETTEKAVRQLENAMLQIRNEIKDTAGNSVIKHWTTTIGAQPYVSGFSPSSSKGVNVGEVTVELTGADHRKSPHLLGDAIVGRWRELTGDIPGAVELTFIMQTHAGGNAIDLQLSGHDMEELDGAAKYLKSELAKIPDVTDIADSNLEGKREFKLEMLPAGEALGLRLNDIAKQVRQAFYGEEVQRLQRGRDEVRVFVRYPQEERKSLQNLTDMKIRVPSTQGVPTEIHFSEVATGDEGRGFSTIQRQNRSRSIRVTADIDRSNPKANANEVVANMEANIFPKMHNLFPGVRWSFEGEQKDQREDVNDMLKGMVLAMIAIYMVLALPLRSYSQPLLVMSVIPFGMIGAVVGHLYYGMNFSIMSLIGVIALSGVVLNESLVLVEFINRRRREGLSLKEAVKEGGVERFTPIFLTSVTSFIGLAPLVASTSIQAKFLIPMAISLAFGGLFNLVNTLILVPCLYLILEDLKKLVYKKEALQAYEASLHELGRQEAEAEAAALSDAAPHIHHSS